MLKIIAHAARALALVFLLAACAPLEERTLELDGVERKYLMYAPEPTRAIGAAPAAVIALHGGGNTARSFPLGFDLRPLAEANNFIAVYPQSLGTGWNDGRPIDRHFGDDVAFLDALIEELIAEFNVDEDRVYLFGVSNGGYMVFSYLCAHAERIAAAVPVIGGMSVELLETCMPDAPVPLMMINGDIDPFVPFEGGPIFSVVGDRGTVLGVFEAADFWAMNNGCPGDLMETRLPNPDFFDNSSITRWDYANCAHAPVTVHVVNGGGHTWPGGIQWLPEDVVGPTNRDADTLELIWDFFSQH